MSEEDGVLLFIGALVLVQPLTLLVALSLLRRNMAREAKERTKNEVEVPNAEP